jgi:hypothetical protein
MNQRAATALQRPDVKGGSQSEEDEIERSGAAIISLLDQAVETSKAEVDRARETARQYSLQLRAAEDRAIKLQARVEQLEEQLLRAEDWFHRIQGTIEESFFMSGISASETASAT